MATGNGKQFFSKRARWTCTGCQRRTRAYRNSLALCNACQTTFTGFTEGHASGPDIRNARTKNPAHQETGTTINEKAWEETSKEDSERRKAGQSDKRPTNLEIRHTPRQDSPLHRRPYTQPEFEDELRSATKKPDDALTLVSVLTSPNRTSLSKPLLEPLSGPQKEHIHPRRDKPACSVATPNKTRRMNLAPPFDEQRKDPVKPFAPHQSQGGCKVEPSNRVSEHKQRHTVVQVAVDGELSPKSMALGECDSVADFFRMISTLWKDIGVDERSFVLEIRQRWKSPGTGGDYIYLEPGSEVGLAELFDEIEQDPCWEGKAATDVQARCTIFAKLYYKL